jgi:methionine aminopeptidase
MQTIELKIPDNIYNQLSKSGIDIKQRLQDTIYDLLDDGYPSISINEATKRVSDAIHRYTNDTGEYLDSDDYQHHIAKTIDTLKSKYANN